MRLSVFFAMVVGAVGCVAIFVACVGNDPSGSLSSSGGPGDGGANDGNVGSDGGVDATVDGDAHVRPCNADAPFSTPPEKLDVFGGVAPTLSADELVAYVSLADAGVGEIWSATREIRTMKFTTLTRDNAISTGGSNVDPFVTDNGEGLYFARQVDGGSYDLWKATRSSREGAWQDISVLATTVNTGYNETLPSSSTEGLYFSSDRPRGGTGRAIYFAPRQGGVLQQANAITGVNPTNVDDTAPAVTADGLTMYFASDRQESGAKGGIDIWLATRTAGGDFSVERAVSELNTGKNDIPRWVSPDGCRLYFETNGAAWVASKPP